jgi:hypothetical protein
VVYTIKELIISTDASLADSREFRRIDFAAGSTGYQQPVSSFSPSITAGSAAVRPPISDPDGRTRHQPIIVFNF